MSLWKPYADDTEVPLDLSKTTAQVPQPQLPPPSKYPPYSGYFEQVEHLPPGGSTAGSPPTYDPLSNAQVSSPPRHVTASQLAAPVGPVHVVGDNLCALRVMAETNGGALQVSNPRMRRPVRSSRSDAADDAYRRQRERNNVAAKQSRTRRKLREINLGLQVSFLKREFAALKAALSTTVCSRCQQSCLC